MVAKLNYFSIINSSEDKLVNPNYSYFFLGKWNSISWLIWAVYLFLETDCLWEAEETCWIKKELLINNHRSDLYRHGNRGFLNGALVTTILSTILPFLIYHQVVLDKIDHVQSCIMHHFSHTFPTFLYNIPPHYGE